VEEFHGRGENRKRIGFTKKFKLADKLKALELFGKATGFYVERMEVEHKGPLADLSTAILLKMQAELSTQRQPPITISAGKP
jgi:phage terminase small subunit